MSYGVVRSSIQASLLAASLALALPTAATALPASNPMSVARAASQSNFIAPAAWRHGRYWGRRGYGWGGGAPFVGAALGVIGGLAIANSYGYPYGYGYGYGYPYSCDPYDPYDSCGYGYGYPGYYYGYPGYYGYGGGYGYRRGFYGFRHGGYGPSYAHTGRWRR